MSITIHDIARLAGVNASTVSRALRGDPRVRAETVRSIRAIADREGYVPNRNARSLISGRTGVVWLVLASLESELERAVAGFLAEAVRRHGRELLIAPAGNTETNFRLLLERLRQRTADGVVLIPSCSPLPESCYAALPGLPVPVVCIDRWYPDAPAVVANDNVGAVEELARRCLEAGARRFYLVFSGVNPVAAERFEAARRYLERRHIPWSSDPAILNDGAPGILGNSEREALLILQQNGLLPPLKGTLCGGFFDWIDPLTADCFRMRCVCLQDFETMAQTASRMLAERIEHTGIPPEFRRIPVREIRFA